ncbi:MAG: hypothetical protein AAGC93_18150 [Cyanobacteria bacterium P01_F01_bin.53]
MENLAIFKRSRIWLLILLLMVAIGVRIPGLVSRAIWYDESITLLETAGHAIPNWPQQPIPASIAQEKFEGTPTFVKLADDLRRTDVHPPVYYWLLSLWRRWLGFSIETARLFSLICSIGTVLSLYCLLKAGKFEQSFVPTLVYALSTGAVLMGHEARAYALASLFIGLGALFAYLASEMTSERNSRQVVHKSRSDNKSRLVIYAVAMALCCGVAFQTNYLALFPVSIILLWFVIYLWSTLRLLTLFFPMMAVSIWLIGFPSFLTQLSARPQAAAGFIGFLPEVGKILKMNIGVVWTPIFDSSGLTVVFGGVLIVLLGTSFRQILGYWSNTNRKLLLLLLGLALSPSVGLFLMDVLSDKNLNAYRYLLFAGPALTALLTYGLTHSRPVGLPARLFARVPSRFPVRLTGRKILLLVLLGLQLIGINWGTERTRGWGGSHFRSLASTIQASSSASTIVVIDAGGGRGYAGPVVYELAPTTMVSFLLKDSTVSEMYASLQQYDDIWLLYSSASKTAELKRDLLNELEKAGYRTQQQSAQGKPLHLSRTPQ